MNRLLRLFSTLVIGLALLLFAQWPLRELVHNYSRLANDMAQLLFGLYAAAAISAATRAGSHLCLRRPGGSGSPAARWRFWATVACVLPWACMLLWTAVPQALVSVRALEVFSEGLSPGYFVLRLALVLLPLLVLADLAGLP
jgi:TRAP-type C4-dicarboxylate transport system permease small subunit